MMAKIFNDGTDGEHFKMFHDNLCYVTDPKAYMVFEFARFDIYADSSQLAYLMKQAFLEVDEGQVTKWLSEFKEPHHVIIP